jgi:transcriptional regulator with XRE-family HTH domain
MHNGYIWGTITMQFDPAKLKHYRVYKVSLSMQQLAKKAGLAYRTVFSAESGNVPPTVSTIRKLAEALAVNIEDLMMVEGNGNTSISEKAAPDSVTNFKVWATEEILRYLKTYQKEILEKPHNPGIKLSEQEKQQNYALVDEITWHVLRAEERLHQVKSL